MLFYLGTHLPNWLSSADYPLFISRRRIAKRKRMPLASDRWALDSGGFSEVSTYGKWITSEAEYLDDIARCSEEAGLLDWAAPQDWMCEPWILQKTGLTVHAHQQMTIESFLRLRAKAKAHVIPVLQGWNLTDYHQHMAMYRAEGIELEQEPTVGLGSVCRRQATSEIGEIVQSFHGLRMHGFGVKMRGLQLYGHLLHSADSMAWSFDARRKQKPLDGCEGHINCANCLRYASEWRESLLRSVANSSGRNHRLP